jgi:hypothetical protein
MFTRKIEAMMTHDLGNKVHEASFFRGLDPIGVAQIMFSGLTWQPFELSSTE